MVSSSEGAGVSTVSARSEVSISKVSDELSTTGADVDVTTEATVGGGVLVARGAAVETTGTAVAGEMGATVVGGTVAVAAVAVASGSVVAAATLEEDPVVGGRVPPGAPVVAGRSIGTALAPLRSSARGPTTGARVTGAGVVVGAGVGGSIRLAPRSPDEAKT